MHVGYPQVQRSSRLWSKYLPYCARKPLSTVNLASALLSIKMVSDPDDARTPITRAEFNAFNLLLLELKAELTTST